MAGLGKIKKGCDAAQCDFHPLRGAVSRVHRRQQGSMSFVPRGAANGLLSVAIKNFARGGRAFTPARPCSAATQKSGAAHTVTTSVASADRKRRLTPERSAKQNDRSRRACARRSHLRVTG